MKNFILIIFGLLVATSCITGKKERLTGTWVSVSEEKSATSGESVPVHYFIEFTDEAIFYLNQLSGSKYYFYKGYSMDSIHFETIKFRSNDSFEILFPDSVKGKLKMSENPVYKRINKEIKPNQMIYDLFDMFFPLGNTLEVDTLQDGTIYYHSYLPANENMSVTELENEIKFFIDKQMKCIPGEVLLNEYDQSLGKTFNEYTWENPGGKIFMQCYFNFRDAAGRSAFNRFDRLEVKILQNIK